MTTTTKTRETTLPTPEPRPAELSDIAPLATDPRVQEARDRVNALRQRLEAVQQQMADGRVDPTGDYVERLLADPRAVLTPPPDRMKALEAEAKALPRAIDAAESGVQRVRSEVSLERARVMRPATVASARELMAILERATELIKAEAQLCTRLNALDYAWEGVLPRLAFQGDLDNVDRLVQRVRASGLLED